MLTRKQHELLMFIHERIKETGVSPSFDEMKEALDLASKSGIHRLITALEERGFIRRLAHRARALEVVKLPQQATTAAPPRGRSTFRPQVIEGAAPAAPLPAATATDPVSRFLQERGLLVQAQGAHDFGNDDTSVDRTLSLAAVERLASVFA